MQFIVFVRWAAVVNTVQPFAAAAAAADTASSQHTEAYSKMQVLQSIYKMLHIFHSLIYPLQIFTCLKSFAGYCNCVQGTCQRYKLVSD
jgi:hypothetical protein